MSVALIEPFDRWFLSLSKGSGTTRRNDCYTKCGGFDKLNHRNANLLDSPVIFLNVKNFIKNTEPYALLQFPGIPVVPCGICPLLLDSGMQMDSSFLLPK